MSKKITTLFTFYVGSYWKNIFPQSQNRSEAIKVSGKDACETKGNYLSVMTDLNGKWLIYFLLRKAQFNIDMQ